MQMDRSSFAAALAYERGFVVIAPDTALIPLQRKDAPTGEYALVSREDRHLGRFYWGLTPYGYARRRTAESATLMLHREVMGLEVGDGVVVDHLNRDRLDCRRGNLRIVTQAQNCQNQSSRGKTSKFRGVSLRRRDGTWIVMHKIGGKNAYGGTFATEAEANDAAVAWRREHMPFATD